MPSGHSIAMRICGPGSGKLGRGLAQPSDNRTLRLPDVILAFNEWQLKAGVELGENGSIVPRPKGKPR